MVDIVSKETRSRMMAAVRKQNTSPEILLRKALRMLGVVGYRLHRKDIAGCPDLAWLGRRVAVFVDGSFWHGHPSAYTPGKSGAFWDHKISQNIDRDRRIDAALQSAGWIVLRIWDFEIKRDPNNCAERVRAAVHRRDCQAPQV
jgi:DNA mismatch endonuclease (patch repair protein)